MVTNPFLNKPQGLEDKQKVREDLLQQLKALEKPEEIEQDKLNFIGDRIINIQKTSFVAMLTSIVTFCFLLLVMLWLTFG